MKLKGVQKYLKIQCNLINEQDGSCQQLFQKGLRKEGKKTGKNLANLSYDVWILKFCHVQKGSTAHI